MFLCKAKAGKEVSHLVIFNIVNNVLDTGNKLILELHLLEDFLKDRNLNLAT